MEITHAIAYVDVDLFSSLEAALHAINFSIYICRCVVVRAKCCHRWQHEVMAVLVASSKC